MEFDNPIGSIALNNGERKEITPKIGFPCSVCGKLCRYNFYGVKCCDSCKQFFRRVVLKQRDYVCRFDGLCGLENHCLACRLDECLKAGMEPRMVTTDNGKIVCEMSYIRRLTARRAKLLIKGQRNMCPNKSTIHPHGPNCNQLNSMLELEQKQRIVWEADADPSLQFLDQFNSLEEMLAPSAGSIFDQMDNYNWCQPNTWDKPAYMELCDNYGIDNADSMRYIANDMLLVVQMAKTMPCFQQLKMPDKICLLRQIVQPVGILMNSFYCANHETWTRSSGITFASAFRIERFKCDKKLADFSIKFFSKTIDDVKNASLGREEFMLLLVLLLSSSTASELSSEARELLYTESCRYSALLLNLYQLKNGPAQGASLFAQAIHLLEHFFQLVNEFRLMSTYIEICYFPRNPNVKPLKGMRAINFF